VIWDWWGFFVDFVSGQVFSSRPPLVPKIGQSRSSCQYGMSPMFRTHSPFSPSPILPILPISLPPFPHSTHFPPFFHFPSIFSHSPFPSPFSIPPFFHSLPPFFHFPSQFLQFSCPIPFILSSLPSFTLPSGIPMEFFCPTVLFIPKNGENSKVPLRSWRLGFFFTAAMVGAAYSTTDCWGCRGIGRASARSGLDRHLFRLGVPRSHRSQLASGCSTLGLFPGSGPGEFPS